MQFRGEFVQLLLDWVISKRRSPNRIVRPLLSSAPNTTVDEFLIAVLETALKLEEMYDEVHRNEWNDWQRVDYWTKISSNRVRKKSATAELLQLKSELYRIAALIAADAIFLRREGTNRVKGNDLLRLWELRGSEYF